MDGGILLGVSLCWSFFNLFRNFYCVIIDYEFPNFHIQFFSLLFAIFLASGAAVVSNTKILILGKDTCGGRSCFRISNYKNSSRNSPEIL